MACGAGTHRGRAGCRSGRDRPAGRSAVGRDRRRHPGRRAQRHPTPGRRPGPGRPAPGWRGHGGGLWWPRPAGRRSRTSAASTCAASSWARSARWPWWATSSSAPGPAPRSRAGSGPRTGATPSHCSARSTARPACSGTARRRGRSSRATRPMCEAQASTHRLTEVAGPPVLPAHRCSMPPSALSALTGEFVAEVGVGLVHLAEPARPAVPARGGGDAPPPPQGALRPDRPPQPRPRPAATAERLRWAQSVVPFVAAADRHASSDSLTRTVWHRPSGPARPFPARTGYGGGEMDLHLVDDELASCVGCGLCLPHCPTYRVTGEEALSPRGRIAAMRAVHWDGAPADGEFVHFMETCVQCRGCEPACPSGGAVRPPDGGHEGHVGPSPSHDPSLAAAGVLGARAPSAPAGGIVGAGRAAAGAAGAPAARPAATAVATDPLARPVVTMCGSSPAASWTPGSGRPTWPPSR